MKRPLLIYFLIFFSMIFALNTGAWAFSALWQESGVPVSPGDQNQDDPSIASDGAGGAIISWDDFRNSEYGDIYAQRVSANGQIMWPSGSPDQGGVPICISPNSQGLPQIISDGSGGAIIAWADYRRGDTAATDIYAQKINANGVVQWTAGGNIICTSNVRFFPQVRLVSDGAGGAIICWDDKRNGTDHDIYARKINSNGVVQWQANGVPICTQSKDQRFPQIITDGSGGAIIAWFDYRTVSPGNGVYAQKINAGGAVQWDSDGKFIVKPTGGNDFSIISDGSGGMIISWTDLNINTIKTERYDASGSPQWPGGGINCIGKSNISSRSITSDGSGGAIIFAAFYNPTSDICAQRINANGQILWPVGDPTTDAVPVCTAEADQMIPEIIGDGSGGAVVAWLDNRNGDGDIYAQRINSSGIILGQLSGEAVCTAGGDQYSQKLANDGSGGAIIVWGDPRSSGGTPADIYAQRAGGGGAHPYFSVSVTPASAELYASSSNTTTETTYYCLMVINEGDTSDSFTLSATNTPSWTTAFYPEDDNKGVPSTGSITTIEGLAAGASKEVFVGIIPPLGGSIGTVNTTKVTVTSAGDASKTATATLETIVGNWMMFHHDLQHTGRSLFKGPAHGVLKWSYATGGFTYSSPAIGSDGTVYVGSGDNNLYAINTDGSLKWSYATGSYIDSSPAIGPDGTVYVGSNDKKLYAINPGGNLKWSYTAGDYITTSPAIGPDGTVYVGSYDNKLYAINPGGSLKWSYATGKWIDRSSPAIGPDGTVYVGSNDKKLYAINPGGSLKWSYTAGNQINSSPVIGPDGTVYVGSVDSNLYAINPGGSLKWSYATGGSINSSPAIGSDGTVYVGSGDNNLYAINPDGSLKWSYATDNCIDSSPAIGSDGTVYVGSEDNNLYAINPDGSLKWSYAAGDYIDPSPAIGSDGTVYVGSLDNNLYAITEDITPPVVTIEAPATGNIITGETQYLISWEASDNGQPSDEAFTIWFSGNKGNDWELVTGEVSSLESTYLWKVPNVPTDEAMISVECEDWAGNTGYGISGTFEITEAPPYYSVSVTPASAKLYASSSSTIVETTYYCLTVNNEGNKTDSFTLSATNTPSWTTAFYPEDDNKGVPSTGSITTIEGLAAGASKEVFVGIIPPLGGSIGTVNTTEVTVTSAGDASKTATATLETTVGNWMMFHHDLQHTGRSLFKGPAQGILKWSYTTADIISSSPAIGTDGNVYVGSGDNKLYAIKPDGSLKWKYTAGGGIRSSPAIGPDGTVYVGSQDNSLYAIKPDGALKWSYATGWQITSSPAIGPDGTVYIGSWDNNLYAVKPDGSLKWSYGTGGMVRSSPAIGPDGTVYVGSGDNNLYAINPDGGLKWSYATGGGINSSSPAIGPDGTVYVGSWDKNIYAIKPDGSLKWSYATGNWVDSSPAIGSDGIVYVGSDDNSLYAINPDGGLKWSYATGDFINSSPAIGPDGTVYVGSRDGNLYAIKPDGSLKWSSAAGDRIETSSPAIGPDGTVYVGSWDNKLYAFTEGEIIPPVVTVEAPNGGEILTGGVTYEVRWSATAEAGIKGNGIAIYYSLNSGISWNPIVSWLSNTGIYSWEVASVDSANCRVSVEAEDIDGNKGSDVSNGDFMVDSTAPLAPQTLTASPESWTTINNFTVTWENPADLSGIAGAYYKLDAPPASEIDGTYKTSTDYQFITKWGNQGTGDGEFGGPSGIVVDSSGKIYEADGGNYRIQKFTSDGTFFAKWGSQGTGDGEFNYPSGVGLDSSGNVYVTDLNNRRIQKFTSDGTFLAKWGSQGTGDGEFNDTYGVAVDSSGNVYVADSQNNRIQKFTSDGTFLAKWGSYGTGDGEFNQPLCVALDSSGNVYVTDYDNHRIQKFTSDGTFLAKWGSYGTGDGEFNQPFGVAVDSSRNVYVADTGNNRIQKFDSDGGFIAKWGSQGSGDGQFSEPLGVALDSSGNVYVLDHYNYRIQKFAPSPITQINDITVSGDGLHPVYVWLKDYAGNVDHSKTSSAVLYLVTSAPAAPVGLDTTGITTNSAGSTWGAVTTATSYTISYGTNEAATNKGIMTTIEASYQWINLIPATRYYWKVSATNEVGEGPYSSIASFETLASGGPPPSGIGPTIEAVWVNGLRFRSGDPISKHITLEVMVSSEPGGVVLAEMQLDEVHNIPLTFVPGSGTVSHGRWAADLTIPPSSQERHIMILHFKDSYLNETFTTMEAVLKAGGVQVIGTPNNYPNPFSPMSGGSTTIQYILSTDATITIIIYDISGHEVKRMKFRGGSQGGRGGTNQAAWDGRSLGREVVGNGMYFYKIISGNSVIGSGKLVILDQ